MSRSEGLSFFQYMRGSDSSAANELIQNALKVIDLAFEEGALKMLPLFSGGHDSLSACYIASHHRAFEGCVYHIDTGIGAKATRTFIESTCEELDWELKVFRSKATYERFVSKLGFPGPGAHQWVYNWLKDRCISTMTKGLKRVALITGCRSAESVRRMGHVKPLQIGEISKKTGKVTKKNRYWTAPCHDWTTADQVFFMDAMGLSRNPIRQSPLGMSGECFCGAFARPNEIALIRQYAPDVAEEIDRLTKLAAKGRGQVWGTRSKKEKGIIRIVTGPLCSSCDQKARASGLFFDKETP